MVISGTQMTCSNWTIVGRRTPPVKGGKGGSTRRPSILATKRAEELPFQPSLQVMRSEEDQNLSASKAMTISRRNTTLCMTLAILGSVSLFSADPAKARIGRVENRKKAMEKLEKLRDKAGVPESRLPLSTKEGKIPSSPQSRILTGRLVEVSLP